MLEAPAQTVIEKRLFFERTRSVIQWEEIASYVAPFLKAVRRELASQAGSFAPSLSEFFDYALSSHGKLLRPAVFALSGFATGTFGEHSVKAATVVEMIHLASLIHDDVIDDAEIRRKRPTLSRYSDNRSAVLLGDCILTQAVLMVYDFKNDKASHLVLNSSRSVCIGETIQSLRSEKILNTQRYFEIIALKTGELFALAAELGALLAGATPQTCSLMREYGLALGTCYQVYDDCVDVFSSEESTGKSTGIDLSSGKYTLPILLLLGKAAESEQPQIRAILENWTPARAKEILPFFKKYSILNECVSAVEPRLEVALEIAKNLAPSEHQAGLIKLLQFLSQQFSRIEG